MNTERNIDQDSTDTERTQSKAAHFIGEVAVTAVFGVIAYGSLKVGGEVFSSPMDEGSILPVSASIAGVGYMVRTGRIG